MASNIGVKIANGEFYPLLEENSSVKKRIILSTVHNNQSSVQIDLYRSSTNNMQEAQYIGSIVVENIKPRPKGEPSIELVISSNKEGDIVANAVDLDTGSGGENHVLTVSLKSLDETSRDLEISDFEEESNEKPPSSLYQHAKAIRQTKRRRSFAWLFILIGLIIILGLLAGWLFFFGGMDKVKPFINDFHPVQSVQQIFKKLPWFSGSGSLKKQAAPEPVKIETVRETVAQPVQTEVAPVIQPVAEPPPPQRVQTAQSSPLPPVASYNVPAVIPREGVNYVIRWGDTLWAISEAFYRDPWQYRKIASYNNIRNPNHIISGRIIRIPPKN